MQVLAREFRAVRGKGRVVGVPGGVLGGRVEGFGFTDAGMPGDKAGRQREDGECKETHDGEINIWVKEKKMRNEGLGDWSWRPHTHIYVSTIRHGDPEDG